MIISIIIKNLKTILRSPLTIVILILAPIILMLIVGYTYSGDRLTNTYIGIINYNGDFFKKFDDINFGNFDQDLCLEFLKKGIVDLCIDYSENLDAQGQITSANMIYYADITRPQISQILINSINREIDIRTRDISTKTINSIFSEINETVIFMENSLKIIDNVEESIDDTKTYLSKIRTAMRLTNNKIDTTNNELETIKFNIDRDYNNYRTEQSGIISDLYNIDNQIGNSQNLIDESISSLNSVISGILAYGEINSDIYDYVSINTLNSINSNLNDISESLDYTKSLTSSASNSLGDNNLDYIIDIKNTVDEIIDLFTESKNHLKDIENQITNFENEINAKENELITAKDEVDNKLNYFSDLSDKDASEIAEPISKKTIYTFNNFKRVHQLAPTVVVLVILFVGLLLSNILVSLEVNSKAYFRNLISPVPQSKFIIGLFFTSLIIISFQLLFLFLILYYNFSVPIFGNFWQIAIVIIHSLIVFILLGFFLGYLIPSIQISILLSTFLMLIIFLMSNIIVPIQIIPKFISFIISTNPIVITEELIRRLFYYKEYYTLDLLSLIPFYIFAFILLFLISYASKKRKNNIY